MKMEGGYQSSHSCNSGNQNYNVDIDGSVQSQRIYISNFYNFGVTVYVDVNCEEKTLTIPSQSVGGSTWVGSGYYFDARGNLYLDFQRFFTLNGTNHVDNCDATLYP